MQAIKPDLTLRWAALLHDVAKGMDCIRGFHNGRITDRGHDQLGAQMAEVILTRLQYPKKMVQRVAWLVSSHMRFHFFANNQDADPWRWMRKEAQSGRFRKSSELKRSGTANTSIAIVHAMINAPPPFAAHTRGNRHTLPVPIHIPNAAAM